MAARLGADAIGLVFFAKSPRNVLPEQAARIVNALPPFVTTVGLFVNPEQTWVHDVLNHVQLDMLQFHGEESPGDCERYGRPYLKAIRMKEETDLAVCEKEYTAARGLLVDTFHPDVAGGTGEAFDWSRVPAGLKKPIILAGGLGPDNVQAAIRQTRPWGVDVSSGVESEKGIKDAEKMRLFIEQVRKTL